LCNKRSGDWVRFLAKGIVSAANQNGGSDPRLIRELSVDATAPAYEIRMDKRSEGHRFLAHSDESFCVTPVSEQPRCTASRMEISASSSAEAGEAREEDVIACYPGAQYFSGPWRVRLDREHW
jgi:hypothetical protein